MEVWEAWVVWAVAGCSKGGKDYLAFHARFSVFIQSSVFLHTGLHSTLAEYSQSSGEDKALKAKNTTVEYVAHRNVLIVIKTVPA